MKEANLEKLRIKREKAHSKWGAALAAHQVVQLSWNLISKQLTAANKLVSQTAQNWQYADEVYRAAGGK